MEPTSPKGKDLQRDARYTLHCAVEDWDGGGGEFCVSGRATRSDDALVRKQAVQAASYTTHDRYILFVLTIESATMKTYTDGTPSSRRWSAPK